MHFQNLNKNTLHIFKLKLLVLLLSSCASSPHIVHSQNEAKKESAPAVQAESEKAVTPAPVETSETTAAVATPTAAAVADPNLAANSSAPETPAPETAPAKVDDKKSADSGIVVTVKNLSLTPNSKKAESHEQAKSSSHAAHGDFTPVPALKSLSWLQNGNLRYLTQHYRADGRADADRKRLSSGQHPHAIILSCSDSRVPPEIIFDQMLGEVFVIRVAGEALDSSVIASIEYAVEHLGSQLLVVMGHTQCGAVKATLNSDKATGNGSLYLDQLIADIKPRLSAVKVKSLSKNLEVESATNAQGVAQDLLKKSEILQHAVESGKLTIKPALYHIETGKVVFY